MAARALARKHWRLQGARSEKEARGFWTVRCRQRLGVACARAFARCRLSRLQLVGVPRAVLEARPRRGAHGAAAHVGVAHAEDLHAFMAYQAHMLVPAA